jgi:hypothetical protein
LFGSTLRCFHRIKGQVLQKYAANTLDNGLRPKGALGKPEISHILKKILTSFLNPFENRFLIVLPVAVIAKIRIAGNKEAMK